MKLSKNAKISIIIIAVLVVIFSISLTLFLLSNRENRNLYLQEKIKITAFGEKLGEYTLGELLEVSPAQEFEAVYKPNNMKPVKKTYTGIYLKDLVVGLDVDINRINHIKFAAGDGLQKIYGIQDVLEESNVYIAYLVNGKPFNTGILSFAYNKPEEDGGPFVVIRAKDKVSQNRVKLLVEIIIE